MNQRLTLRPLVTCPHCGHEQAIMLDVSSTFGNRFFHYCDIERGGCDELFAFEVELKTSINVWKLEPVQGVDA